MSYENYINTIKLMIDELKALSTDLGLSNTGDEYKIISELFTYKFLNDKVEFEYKNRTNKNEDFDTFCELADSNTAKMYEKHRIRNLYHRQDEENFHKILDESLVEVSKLNEDVYSVETVNGKKKGLFEPLASYVRDENKELELAKRAINILYNREFEAVFSGGFDYFSSVFEYLIKDYNKDSGKYAEYFTPGFAGNIMADILYDDTPIERASLYDPAGGSGTLVLSMANIIGTNNCSIYTQDISQKSTQFLRINLILNNLSHSLENVIEGNTLIKPFHKGVNGNIKKFDFIVSNPPFNVDFSAIVEELESDPFERFFAGIPNVPEKKKSSMAIYLVFLQHIISSLNNERGKAAVVVPTGFVSASTGIALSIKKHLVDNNMLKAVVHMPAHIFANTGTSVSIVFIEYGKADDKVILVDASKLGQKIKFEDGQRTLLKDSEIEQIIVTTKKRIEKPDFSKLVSNQDIKNNNYSIQAGIYTEMSPEVLDYDIDESIENLKSTLKISLDENIKLSRNLIEILINEEK